MKYFKLITEGARLENGFNFYRPSSRSIGFKFRYGKRIPMTDLGSKVWFIRWNMDSKRLFTGHLDVSSAVSEGWTITQADIDTLEDDLQQLMNARHRGIRK